MRQVALNTHISGTFNIELENLRNSVLTMGGEVEQQLVDTLKAVKHNHAALADDSPAPVAASIERTDLNKRATPTQSMQPKGGRERWLSSPFLVPHLFVQSCPENELQIQMLSHPNPSVLLILHIISVVTLCICVTTAHRTS